MLANVNTCKLHLVSKQSEQPAWRIPAVPAHHHDGPCKCQTTIVYIRVSKAGDRAPEELLSPHIQLDACADYCERTNKRIVKILADINFPGDDFSKRSVDAAIKEIKLGNAQSITVWKWSRWGRNVGKSISYIGLTKAAGGNVYSATEQFDENTAVGKLSLNQIHIMNQFQRDQISENWKAAHGQRRKNGLPHSGRKRFGYSYIGREQVKAGVRHPGSADCSKCAERTPHFVVHETEGPVLKQLYMDYVSGTSVRQLSASLNSNGFKTPMDGAWTPQALGQMLDTGFGAGLLRERSEGVLAQLKAAEKRLPNSLSSFDVWRAGSQPKIIDEELWNEYKAKRTRAARLPPRLRSPRHALSGLVICGVCARRMQPRYPGTGSQMSWACIWKDSFHDGVSVSVSNAKLLESVKSWLDARSKPPRVDVASETAKELRVLTKNSPRRTVQQIDHEIETEEVAATKLSWQHSHSLITDSRFERLVREVDEKIAELKIEKAELEQVKPVTVPSYEKFRDLSEIWDETLASEPGDLNKPLVEVLGFVIVSSANGRKGRQDISHRVELVEAWLTGDWADWFSARRRRFLA